MLFLFFFVLVTASACTAAPAAAPAVPAATAVPAPATATVPPTETLIPPTETSAPSTETPTSTSTSTPTATQTATPTSTATASSTPTATPTRTATRKPTAKPTTTNTPALIKWAMGLFPGGQRHVRVVNNYPAELTLTIEDKAYKIPAKSEGVEIGTFDAGNYTWTAVIPGVAAGTGSLFIWEGRDTVLVFGERG